MQHTNETDTVKKDPNINIYKSIYWAPLKIDLQGAGGWSLVAGSYYNLQSAECMGHRGYLLFALWLATGYWLLMTRDS